VSEGSQDAAERVEAGAGPRFRLPIYEGPLDLLLHLIKRAELDARDVTASVITEQYLAYLEVLDSLNLDVAGEYLVMAATLLLIKSFSMLPHAGTEELEEAEELKRDLVARLLEYQRYREAAEKLGERALLGRDVFAAPGEKLPDEAPEADGQTPRLDVSLFDLVEAMAAVLKRLTDTTARAITLRDIPVAECIPRIMAALDEGAGTVEFAALFENFHDPNDRPAVIATFMALLELIRQGRVRARQAHRYGPILLERREQAASGETPPSAPAGSEQR
jgi:segregation and condensation protein A